MPSDASEVDAAVIARLQNDAALAALMPHGVFFDIAAPGATKFVIVSQLAHEDQYQFPGASSYEKFTYLVKAVHKSDSGGEVKKAAHRIHELLEDALLTPTGYDWMRCERISRDPRNTEYDETSGVRWQHRGGQYEVWVSPSPELVGYDDAVLADAPLAFWRLDDPSGTAVRDKGGSPQILTASSPVEGWTPRDGAVAANASMTFAAGRKVVGTLPRIPYAFLEYGPYTVEFWLRGAVPSANALLIDLRGGHGFSLCAMVAFISGELKAFRRNDDGTSQAEVAFPLSVFDGAWHHLAFALSETAMVGYVDGELLATVAAPTGIFALTDGALMGFGANAGADADYFEGGLDEIALYDKQLTPARLRAHYEARTRP